jgi:hypothetical protein
MSNNQLTTNSKNLSGLQVSKNLPALLAVKSVMPTHKLVKVVRKRGELLLEKDILAKKCLHLVNLMKELEQVQFANDEDYCRALKYYDDLLIELKRVEAEGLEVKAELEALPMESVSFKEMKVAVAEYEVAQLLTGFLKLLGLDSDKNKLGGLTESSAVIVASFGWLTIEGLATIFKRAITGELVIYGTLNLPTICKWIREYEEEFNKAWMNESVSLHLQSKGEGNRGWEQLEAKKEALGRMVKKERARDEAMHRVQVDDYVNEMRAIAKK